MSEHIPAGMVTIARALAFATQTWFPAKWSAAKPEDQWYFDGGQAPQSWLLHLPDPPDSLPNYTYRRMRPLLADGTLPTFIRTECGEPAHIKSSTWSGTQSDSVYALIEGVSTFAVEDGSKATGQALVWGTDLEAVLRGEPAPSLASTAPPQKQPEVVSAKPKNKGGRRTKPGIDDLWIEACRMVNEGEQGARGQLQIGFINALEDWSRLNQVSDPYKSDSIKKKIEKLWKALKLG